MGDELNYSLENSNETKLSQIFPRDKLASFFSELFFSILLGKNIDWKKISKEDYNYNYMKKIKAAVKFFDIFIKDQHKQALEKYFKTNQVSRKTVFRFYRNYCFNVSELHENSFLIFIHSLALARRIIKFFGPRDYKCFYYVFPIYWDYVFSVFIKEKFCKQGGWKALRTYLSTKFYPCPGTNMEFFWNFPCTKMPFSYPWLEIIVEDDYCISD